METEMTTPRIDRIILHWTAGADGVNQKEADSYNAIITRTGEVVEGKHGAEDQTPPLVPGRYAAHTLNCNSYSFGVSLDAMADANESPFDPGKYPITNVQLDCLAKYVAKKAIEFGVPVSRKTILTHAEVQPTLGIPQKQKWDITWLPRMLKPGNPVAVGDMLRDMISAAIEKNGSKGLTTPTSLSYPMILKGSHGAFVQTAQERLQTKGYNVGEWGADGLFGSSTDTAVRQFQKDNGLLSDGKVGPATWAKLMEA